MDIDVISASEGDTMVVEHTTVRLVGRFDVTVCPQWRECFDGLLDGDTSTVAVDLGDVDFIDSAGLSELVRAMKRCRGAGGDLRIVTTSEAVRDIFELTGLDKAFTIEQR